MRRGRRLALDVGTVRIGLALSDPDGILASPIQALVRSSESTKGIASLAAAHEVIEVYVGNPISLSGRETRSTQDAVEFATELANLVSVEVRLVDERLTTVSAAAKLRSAGIDSKSGRGLIDSASAVEILETALNFEKRNGTPAGDSIGTNHG